MSAVLDHAPAKAVQQLPKPKAADSASERSRLLKQRLKEAGAEVQAARAASGKPCAGKVAKGSEPVDVKKAELARQALLRDEFVRKATGGVWTDGESREWARVEKEQRMVLMLLAGIDGDLQVLATRAWREFTPPERQAIKGEIRIAKRVFSGLAALTSRMQ